MSILSVRREVSEFRKRYRWMAIVVVLAFGALAGRMIQLQLVNGNYYRGIALENITRTHKLPAMRGEILDRAGNLIASNRASYKVYVTPSLLGGEREVKRLASLLDMSAEEARDLLDKINRVPVRRRTQQLEIFKDVSRERLAVLETHEKDVRGLDVVPVPVRTYPYNALAAHAIGYVNEVSRDDLKTLKRKGYVAGDMVGRMGVERAWESLLKGQDGFTEAVVDVQGQERGEAHIKRVKTRQKDPQPGKTLALTLDMRLMQILHNQFRVHPAGAAVVVDVATGELRALYSKPAYDLNEMAGRLSVTRAKQLDSDPLRPRIDKTLYETYYPGSTLKPVFALAGLQAGSINDKSQVHCPGYIEFGRDRKRCTRIHGNVDLQSAIVQSCNVYFYRLAESLGLDRMATYAASFGFGKKTDIGINTEARGFIPTKHWYTEHYKTPFRVGYTLNEVIGQGNTRVTLIQLAMAYAALANGGTLYHPLLVKTVRNASGSIEREYSPRVSKKLGLDIEDLAGVMKGMRGVIMDSKGTAYDVRVPDGIEIAGKTGTAQVSHTGNVHKGLDLDRDHAWFVGIAPVSQPQFVIVVLVEHGGGGGKYAAPIGIQALQEYLAPPVAS